MDSNTQDSLPSDPSTQNTQKDSSKNKKTTKIKSNNWTPPEEAKLAEAWLHISQQPERGTNQTAETFFKRVTDYLNEISPFETREVASVQIKWSALKTACHKFSGFYGEVERNPPSGTVENDWIDLAIEVYDKLYPRNRFKSLPAWRILSTSPKWMVPQPPPGPLAMSIAQNTPSSDPATPASDANNPSATRAHTPPRPVGNKKTKRMRIEGEKAQELELARQEQIKRTNDLAEQRLQAIKDSNDITTKMAQADAEAKASLVQVNDLKVLMMSEADCHTELAKETLRLMQQRLKEKYQAPDTTFGSTSTSHT